jgi:hypothetical protein
MSSSVYQFLEQKANLSPTDCADLIERNVVEGVDLKCTWTEAKEMAAAYRKYLAGLPIAPNCKKKSFVISYTEIERLLDVLRTAADKQKGVRMYVGLETTNGGWVPRFFAVPCVYNAASKQYDDVLLNQNENDGPMRTTLGDGPAELRPCPDQCGRDNFMNTP